MLVREDISVNKRAYIALRGFLLVFFSKFYIWLSRAAFIKKKLKIIQMVLELEREENLVVNNKDNRVFMSRNYRSDSCSLET